jgi:ring-1,2-phenylacetyl-CoA epoxidase subunit PaaE
MTTTDLPTTGAGARRRNVFHPLRVAGVQRLTDDAAAITFEVPPEVTDVYDFAPGQSLTLRREVDGVEQRRSYSICSPAGDAPRIGVREVPGGLFSTWLVREVVPGDVIEVGPPSGSFTPDLKVSARHVMIGAGSGITPLLSMVASVLEDPGSAVTLLYGNRRSDTVMFAEELADLKDAHTTRLELVHVLSREPREAELFTGRLDRTKLSQLLPRLLDPTAIDHWWLCGPYEMVTDARELLVELGVPRDRVHLELFFVDEEPPKPVRREDTDADGDGSDVTVMLDGRSTPIAIPYDVTILDGAQRMRPDLPFACKGGVCGTCRALVVGGEVDMRRNFALEDDEVDAGFVLTCQTFPVSEEVTVDYDA